MSGLRSADWEAGTVERAPSGSDPPDARSPHPLLCAATLAVAPAALERHRRAAPLARAAAATREARARQVLRRRAAARAALRRERGARPPRPAPAAGQRAARRRRARPRPRHGHARLLRARARRVDVRGRLRDAGWGGTRRGRGDRMGLRRPGRAARDRRRLARQPAAPRRSCSAATGARASAWRPARRTRPTVPRAATWVLVAGRSRVSPARRDARPSRSPRDVQARGDVTRASPPS